MPRPIEPSRPHRRWLALGGVAIALAATQALGSWRESHALMINASASLPNWAFFIERTHTLKRGDHVFFTLKPTPIIRAHWGVKPPPFGKIVYGLPGDQVAREGATVLVNGMAIATLKARTKRGEILLPGPTGIIPPGHYFLGSPHKDGFDSRYADIGFVAENRILGTGVPIL